MPAMLAGDLVVLRPLRAADRATSVRWRNDPDIRDNILGYRFPITEEMEAQWVDAVLEDRSRTRLVLAIEDKADGALCRLRLPQRHRLVRAQCRARHPDRRPRPAGQGSGQRDAFAGRRLCLRHAQPQQAPPARRRLQRRGLAALSRLRLRRGGRAAPAGLHPRPLSRRRAHGALSQPCLRIKQPASPASWRASAAAARAAGRDPASVNLVAVTKTFGPEHIVPVLDAGHRRFGENRVQEAKAKWPALRERYPGIELHLIGPLQSNKARDAVALFDAIHTIDRPKIAHAVAEEMAQAGQAPAALHRGQHRRGAAEGGRHAEGGSRRCCACAARSWRSTSPA